MFFMGFPRISQDFPQFSRILLEFSTIFPCLSPFSPTFAEVVKLSGTEFRRRLRAGEAAEKTRGLVLLISQWLVVMVNNNGW